MLLIKLYFYDIIKSMTQSSDYSEKLLDAWHLRLPTRPDDRIDVPAGRLHQYAYEDTVLLVAPQNEQILKRRFMKALVHGVNLALGYDIDPNTGELSRYEPEVPETTHFRGVIYSIDDKERAQYTMENAPALRDRLVCILGETGVILSKKPVIHSSTSGQ